ncbi:hypothetical protein QTI80_04425 [Clostridium perfringens]|nr:hypothetical protein [Clostridium perfringens]
MKVNTRNLMEQKIIYREKVFLDISFTKLDEIDKNFGDKLEKIFLEVYEKSSSPQIIFDLKNVGEKFKESLKEKVRELQAKQKFVFYEFNFLEELSTLEL